MRDKTIILNAFLFSTSLTFVTSPKRVKMHAEFEISNLKILIVERSWGLVYNLAFETVTDCRVIISKLTFGVSVQRRSFRVMTLKVVTFKYSLKCMIEFEENENAICGGKKVMIYWLKRPEPLRGSITSHIFSLHLPWWLASFYTPTLCFLSAYMLFSIYQTFSNVIYLSVDTEVCRETKKKKRRRDKSLPAAHFTNNVNSAPNWQHSSCFSSK